MDYACQVLGAHPLVAVLIRGSGGCGVHLLLVGLIGGVWAYGGCWRPPGAVGVWAYGGCWRPPGAVRAGWWQIGVA